ncbi:MAG: polyprenyl synthetase family protein [Candidatus Bathyarchaeia archaeon]
MSTLVSKLHALKIYPQVEYALLSRGKRLRPIMAVLSAQSAGGDRAKALPLAIAIELIHTATLVHDDIIDRDAIRRGTPTIHTKWSVEDAILAGDAFIALAIDLAAVYGQEVMRLMARCALELCEGEHMELLLNLGEATEEDYFTKIKKKSASLFRTAAQVGAIVGGGTAREVDSLALFGEHFGIAYQIRDDIADLVGVREGGSSDLKLGRVTLPLIHFYRVSDENRKNLMDRCFGKRDLDQEVIRGLVNEIKDAGSIQYCEQKMVENLEAAYNKISLQRDTPFKKHLVSMLNLIVDDQLMSKYEQTSTATH